MPSSFIGASSYTLTPSTWDQRPVRTGTFGLGLLPSGTASEHRRCRSMEAGRVTLPDGWIPSRRHWRCGMDNMADVKPLIGVRARPGIMVIGLVVSVMVGALLGQLAGVAAASLRAPGSLAAGTQPALYVE